MNQKMPPLPSAENERNLSAFFGSSRFWWLGDLLFNRFFVFFLGFAVGTLSALFVFQDVLSMVDKLALVK